MKKTDNKAKIKIITKVTSDLETKLKKTRNRKRAFLLISLTFFSLLPILMYRDIHNLESKEPSKSAKDVTFWQGLGKFTLWVLGLNFVVTFGAGFLGLAEDEKLHMRNMVERITFDKKLAEKLNAELIKIAPVLKSMAKFISAKSEKLGEKLLNGEVSDKDAEMLAMSMDEYLRSHPKDAKKFLAVLDAAQLPQDAIDKYIIEYVPDTISFNIAQEVKEIRR